MANTAIKVVCERPGLYLVKRYDDDPYTAGWISRNFGCWVFSNPRVRIHGRTFQECKELVRQAFRNFEV